MFNGISYYELAVQQNHAGIELPMNAHKDEEAVLTTYHRNFQCRGLSLKLPVS